MVSAKSFSQIFLGACLLLMSIFLEPLKAHAEGQAGEVPTSDAYIVDSSARDLPEKNGTNVNVEITVIIKAKKAGTYYVVMGFTKEGKWLRGLFSGDEFWVVRKVTLDAGDTKVFRETPPGPPIGKKIWDVGIYRSPNDMVKYR